MPKLSSAFPLVGKKLPQYCKQLKDIPSTEFWIHENRVAEYLQLPQGPEHGSSDVLSAILFCLKKGFGGSTKDKTTGFNTKVLTGFAMVDLREANEFGVFYQVFGRQEEFKTGYLVDAVNLRCPRWFKFGTSCVILLEEQLRIARELTGEIIANGAGSDTVPRFSSELISARRKKSHAKFYRWDSTGSQCYLNWDVPSIALNSLDMWVSVQVTETRRGTTCRRSFKPHDLAMIENDFRLILMCSGILGRIEVVNDSVKASCSTSPWRVKQLGSRLVPPVLPQESLAPPALPHEAGNPCAIPNPSPNQTPTPTDNPCATATPSPRRRRGILPDILRLKCLGCTVEGAILWVKVADLASIELMFHLACSKDIAWDHIESEMTKRGVAVPETLNPLELCWMTTRDLCRVQQNITGARDELIDHLGGYFCPLDNDELLYQWLEDGIGYTNGRRVEADIHELKASRREGLADWAKSILRHVRFAFNLSMSAVSNIWVCFYALIMKRVIKPHSFVTDQAIWNNVMSLWKTDNRIRTKRFLKKIQKKTKHGFQVNFHYSADDSKHFDSNRHVFIVSDLEEVNPETEYLSVPFEPTFRLVTTAPNQVKSDGYKKNANDLIAMLGLGGAAILTGGCNDNANDAQSEIPATVEEIQRQVDLSPDEITRALNWVNGVRRRAINVGDAYHWGNLGVMHASKGMAGDTVNEDHTQIHHRQLLMSMHSLHSDDRAYSQAMMNRVMAGGPKVKQRTWRERQQRWLVNQRYAAHVVSLLNVTDPSGTMCLVAWGLWFANYSRSPWKRRVGQEVALWSSMPAIILALHFEAELGNYFEQGYSWHNRKGPFHSRSGFRMMEIHDYYWDFEMAWWNAAVDNPGVCMPKTMAYLESNFEGNELVTRRKQVERGLRMGRDEIVKMTKRYLLKPPLVILMLTNRKRGSAFLRATLSVLHENSNRAPGVELINDAGRDWGLYIHTSAAERPEDEKLWYNLLTQSESNIDDLLHFWQQFCLNWPVLTGDLQRLSKVTVPTNLQPPTPTTDQAEQFVSSLVEFEHKYPVLFECLYAVFGAMMSNSRLCEQIHGMMRHGLNPNIGMDEADHHRQYSSSTNYEMNEARRLLGDASGQRREDEKKAVKHSKTKNQKLMLCRQVLEGALGYAERVALELDDGDIPTVTEVKLDGRRKQDDKNLCERIVGEDAKATRLTRSKLTVAQVRQLATTTKPTNDATFTFDGTVIIWREKIEELCTVSFWDRVCPKKKFRTTWIIARKSFIWMDVLSLKPLLPFKKDQLAGAKKEREIFNKERWNWGNKHLPRRGPNEGVFNLDKRYEKQCIYSKITSHAQAKIFISQYISQVKEVSKLIHSFIHYNDDGGFDDLSVKKEDIHFLFVHYREGTIDGDAVEPAELALVRTCRQVDPHYTYTNDTAVDMGNEEEIEVEHLDDRVDLDIEMGYVED